MIFRLCLEFQQRLISVQKVAMCKSNYHQNNLDNKKGFDHLCNINDLTLLKKLNQGFLDLFEIIHQIVLKNNSQKVHNLGILITDFIGNKLPLRIIYFLAQAKEGGVTYEEGGRILKLNSS